MIRIGTTILKVAKKEHQCEKCKEIIPSGEIYNTKAGNKGRVFFSHKYHSACWLEDYFAAAAKLAETHAKIKSHASGIRRSKIDKLDNAQRRRRRNLQIYLQSKDIPALIRAYERQSTERVYRVMGLIADRWEEMHAMGTPFKISLVTNTDNPNNMLLRQLIEKYDSWWVDQCFGFDDATVEDKIAALRRTPETDKYPPKWVDKSTAPTVESTLEVTNEPNDDSPTHESELPLDVALDAGLPDVLGGQITAPFRRMVRITNESLAESLADVPTTHNR